MDRNEWKYEIAKRLRKTMEERRMNATELSLASGVGKSDISNYLSGKYKPKQDKIYLLARVLEVDPAWLYCLDMRLAAEDISPEETAERIGSAVKAKNVVSIAALPSHRIPLIGSAAAGEPVFNEEVNVYIDGPAKADCAMRVEGDSMEPTYLDGDILYIRSQEDVDHDGQIAVVVIGDEAVVKHVYRQTGELLLVSDNARYLPMQVGGEDGEPVRILGKVCGFTRMYKD